MKGLNLSEPFVGSKASFEVSSYRVYPDNASHSCRYGRGSSPAKIRQPTHSPQLPLFLSFFSTQLPLFSSLFSSHFWTPSKTSFFFLFALFPPPEKSADTHSPQQPHFSSRPPPFFLLFLCSPSEPVFFFFPATFFLPQKNQQTCTPPICLRFSAAPSPLFSPVFTHSYAHPTPLSSVRNIPSWA